MYSTAADVLLSLLLDLSKVEVGSSTFIIKFWNVINQLDYFWQLLY